ncbi:MAG: lipase maturation factor family protein [Nibricoccus sp.]
MAQKQRKSRHHAPPSAAKRSAPNQVFTTPAIHPAKPHWWQALWREAKDFSGFSKSGATYLWPRWLVLRAVGIVYLFVFGGIIVEGRALVGPAGVLPLASTLGQIRDMFPEFARAVLWAPSLFWLDTSNAMITALAWAGFAAAVAVVLNLWPRMSLFLCWALFVTFVSTWGRFSPAQIDRLIIETALLCIPFAPRGFRPGLGVHSPPHAFAVFTVRWLLFRLMVESGLVKITAADPHWRNLTAMDIMYETSPAPTVIGYWFYHLPHWFHLLEIAFTFVAELLGPLLAVFAGRRGRWFAFICWTLLQTGIQLTCNFGWLNVTAIALGLLLLDDQMLRSAADKLRLRSLSRFLSEKITQPVSQLRPAITWRTYALRTALGFHCYLTLPYFAEAAGLPRSFVTAPIFKPVDWFGGFWSANGYFFFAGFDSSHLQVDFEGSNDDGKTWRTYEYRHVPQRTDRTPPFIAPWFTRFETTLQIQGALTSEAPLLPVVAARLLARDPDVMNRFKRDPFSDEPPSVIRMRRYRMKYTDPETLRRTGHYWTKEFDADYAPAMYMNEDGEIAQFSLAKADAALQSRNFKSAFNEYEKQYEFGNLDAGYRLAFIHTRGLGVPRSPEKAHELFSQLADRGEARAMHQLGMCYEFGDGVPIDHRQATIWYRRAADRGLLHAIYALGTLAAKDRMVPRDDIEGLSLLLTAANRAAGDKALGDFILQDHPTQVSRITGRMTAVQIEQAKKRAEKRR